MANSSVLNEALAHAALHRGRVVEVLEAGCGSASQLDLPAPRRVTGIDIDPEQLAGNRGLDACILGDLQSRPLPPDAFDLVVCVDVLEHLKDPARALDNMVQAVRPGGHLLIACPEPWSFKGLLARYTPHRLRGAIFRLLSGRSHRSMFGRGVFKTFFPTYLRGPCARRALRRWAEARGLTLVHEHAYDAHTRGLRPAIAPLLAAAKGIDRAVTALSGGRVDLLRADYCALYRRGATGPGETRAGSLENSPPDPLS